LTRQDTYHIKDENENMEPRPSPLKMTVSPVPSKFCTSLGDMSLESEEEILNLAEYVIRAYEILGKAICSIKQKLPINSSTSSLQGTNYFLKNCNCKY
jgi:hypothetical protein